MTTQQPSRSRTVLRYLFDQATGEPWPFNSNVLLSPRCSRPDALCPAPATNAEKRFCTTFRWSPRRQEPPPGTLSRPLGPAGVIQSP